MENGLMVLAGADGSGKTTISRLLASYLSSYGSTCVHWFRGTHLFTSVLACLLSRFQVFYGDCNPYYGVCIPEKLRALWLYLEFLSLLPHYFTRLLLRRFCRFVVCDRGVLDFVVWLVVTLDTLKVFRSLCGRFLLRLVTRERVVYLYADIDVLARRADVSRKFIVKELVVYSVLAKYVSSCSIDTGVKSPWEVLRGVLKCLEVQR
uniref:Thymidylate kinase n=1 Tax=Ignisphaera aggregans TaxID=334771 RepID=A0A7C4BCI9_9CREN